MRAVDVETEKWFPMCKDGGRQTGSRVEREQRGEGSQQLTRLRSAVLPSAAALPASSLFRFVNPPTLLPVLLLKSPLLPALDMAAQVCVCFWEENGVGG